MKKQNRSVLNLTALVFFLFYGLTLANPDTGEQVTHKTFDVKPGGILTIDTELGTIHVKTSEHNKVEVITTEKLIGKDHKATHEAFTDFEIAFEQEVSNIRVEGKFKRRREYWQERGTALQIRFLVTVPRQYNLTLKTESHGDIHVGNLEGTLRAETSAGDLSFGEIQGTVWGKTGMSGSITLKACQSDVDVKAMTGNIEINHVTGAVTAKTGMNGNITIKACQSDVDAATAVGTINLINVAGAVTAKGGTLKINNVGGPVKAIALMHGSITLKACQSDVDIKATTGNIEINHVTGAVTAKTGMNGNISVENVKGTVKAVTSTGDLCFEEVKGPIWARTGMTGNIKLKACQSDVNVQTSSGKIHAEMTHQPQSPWNLRTSDFGEIIVTLDPDIAVDLDTQTIRSLESTVPIVGVIEKNKLNGTINGGGPLLKLRASVAEIRFKER